VHAAGRCSCGEAGFTRRGKHLRIKQWEREAATDAGRIRAWWSRYADANIGLALGPSRLVAIDVDPRNGGEESYYALRRWLGSYETVRSLTDEGGTTSFVRSSRIKAIRHIATIERTYTAAFSTNPNCAGLCENNRFRTTTSRNSAAKRRIGSRDPRSTSGPRRKSSVMRFNRNVEITGEFGAYR
jgi:hypothetical protein